MPAKWKRSERLTRFRNADGQLITVPRARARFKHYYLHETPKQELFDAINNDRTRPKQRQKALKELQRRGVKIVWTIPQSS